jgi:TPR repeat protein
MADLQTLLQQAGSGELEAQYAIGNAYHLGLAGTDAHLPTAMRWYHKAASAGHVDAQVNLGVIFVDDIVRAGGTRNIEQARHWFKRAADRGDAQAMFFLGQLTLSENQPAQQARVWFERAGKAGFGPAWNALGNLYARGALGQVDASAAADCYEQGALLGDPHSQFNLGCTYLAGTGRERDLALAAHWYRAAAGRGLPNAKHNLALMMFAGQGVELDMTSAARLLQEAADDGLAQAQHELARRLRIADGVPLDLGRSLHYYRLAAEGGYPEAQFSLGVMLEQGVGLEAPQPAQAAIWYRKLAQEHAHAGAAHNLGILYVQGLGVPKSGTAARALFEYAVSLGSHDALYSLGLLLLRGEDSQRDPVAAATLALIAVARHPRGNGSKLLEAAMRDLSPQQAEEARAAAPHWKPTRVTIDWGQLPGVAAENSDAS